MTSNGMPIFKVSTIDIIKFLIATVILLLGFLWKGEKVGETEELLFFQDYLSKELKNNQEIIDQIHESATEIKDKCTQEDSLCKKIKASESEDIIPYKNTLHKVTYFINDNQTAKKKIVDTIDKIEIKNNESEKRWYATRDTIVLNIWPTNGLKEFQNLSSHELGHIFDLWVIQGKQSTKSKIFTEGKRAVFATDDPSFFFYKLSRTSESIRKKELIKKDFCSWYGMTDPFEDFSECFNLYINNQSFFKFIASKSKILAKKYNFIATLLQGKYMEKNTEAISLVKENTARRPRDTTKL